MNSEEVDRAFRIASQFNGFQCRECKGNQTVGLVYLGVIVVSCENCGADTRKGVITPELLASIPVLNTRPPQPNPLRGIGQQGR